MMIIGVLIDVDGARDKGPNHVLLKLIIHPIPFGSGVLVRADSHSSRPQITGPD